MSGLPSYLIIPFSQQHTRGVAGLLDSIAAEFEETIYAPGSKSIGELAQIPGRSYWVVMQADELVGTFGIALIDNNIAVLKGMMLHKDHRGAETHLANRMLTTAEEAARAKQARQMYLGTMIQFKAAQRFYAKHGYTSINESELPAGFPANPVDKVFYMKDL